MVWNLRSALTSHSLTAGLAAEVVDLLEQNVEWFSLPGGSVLFDEGDPGDALYLVTSGALVATVRQGGAAAVVARIRAGETVGEMALLSGEPRSASVITTRDTSLIRISRDAFERLVARQPAAIAQLTRQLARRLVESMRAQEPRIVPNAVALVPLAPSLPCAELARDLVQRLGNATRRVQLLDAGAAGHTGEWFHEFESAHDLIVYLADPEDSPWTRQCLRQADRILLVVPAGAASTPPESQQDLDAMRQRPCDLVVVHAAATRDDAVSTSGRGLPAVDLRCHIRPGNSSDLDRLARLLSGRAVGVVLSGGGARGFAHIGVVRALRAAGVPFDLLGGTSMGAIVAGGLALEWTDAELEQRMRDAFVTTNPLRDFTLPLIALNRGAEVTRRLRTYFGEARIEDLCRPYFCVSTNLTTAAMKIHRAGPLWRALRASVAIPGLMPPIVENGEVLVDGGVIDGLPVGTMRAMGRGPVVGVNVSTDPALDQVPQQLESGSPWWLLRRGGKDAPGIVSLLMRAGTVNSDAQAKLARGQVDLLLEPSVAEVDLLGWQSFDRAIELGYEHTMRALERLPTPLFPD